jgi:AraC-like DNA-binding protein/mannose-6-phosphate isomerase-like protein (cupin superfamily)
VQGENSALSARRLLEDAIVPLLESGDARFVHLEEPDSSSAEVVPRAALSRANDLPPRFLSPRHAHGAHEICWVIRGKCVLAFDQDDLDLAADDVCLVRPGEVHQLRPAATLEPFETLWWHVTAGGINLSLAGFAGDRHVARGGFVPLGTSPVPALARVVQELEGDRPRRDLLVRTALLELAGLILRHMDEAEARPATPFTAERKGSWHVQRVAQYVEVNHGADVSLRGLAQFAGLSPYYLTRLFARYTGRGVMTFLGDVRHREALSLLRNTDLAVAEVARNVGYEDPYYFSRVFRAREGSAPLHYRRRFRQTHA